MKYSCILKWKLALVEIGILVCWNLFNAVYTCSSQLLFCVKIMAICSSDLYRSLKIIIEKTICEQIKSSQLSSWLLVFNKVNNTLISLLKGIWKIKYFLHAPTIKVIGYKQLLCLFSILLSKIMFFEKMWNLGKFL